MSKYFRLEKSDDHFELVRTTYPEFRAEVDLRKAYPRLKKIKTVGKAKLSDLRRSKKEALLYLEYLVLMGE